MTDEAKNTAQNSANGQSSNGARGKAGVERGKVFAFSVVGLLVLLLVVALMSGGGSGAVGDEPYFEARRGPLVISVAEAGTVKARENVIIKSQVSGRPTIIYLVPEGTRVEEGQLLVELDTSEIDDKRVDQEIRVKNSDTSFIRARENLQVVKNQAASDESKAALEHQFAKEDLTQYNDGEYPKLLKEAEARITLEEQELELATEKLIWSEKLFEEQYISQSDLDADRLSKNRARLDHDLAVASRDLLKNYTYQRRVAELESSIEQTEQALERVRIKGSSDIIQAEADLRNKEAELRQQREKLQKLEDQMRLAKIYAPATGMVVYASSTRSSWRGNDEPLDEGQTVREREELIHLPISGALMAEIKVHESNLDKVALGQTVHLTLDALPGEVLTGKVSKIAPLPDASSRWMNPDLKVYKTEIDLDHARDELRTGMSCRAEIIVADYDDVVYVPVQCVVRKGDDTVVYLKDGDEGRPRKVELGLDNNQMACILGGLEAGEMVMLNPPLAETGGATQMRPTGGVGEKSAKPSAPSGSSRDKMENRGAGGSGREGGGMRSSSGRGGGDGGYRGRRGGGESGSSGRSGRSWSRERSGGSSSSEGGKKE